MGKELKYVKCYNYSAFNINNPGLLYQQTFGATYPHNSLKANFPC